MPTGTWLVGMAVATTAYLVSVGLAGREPFELVVQSTTFAVIITALGFALLPALTVARRGFSARFGMIVGVWGGLFGIAMGVGLAVVPGVLLFWVPAALITSAPLVVGAALEFRR